MAPKKLQFRTTLQLPAGEAPVVDLGKMLGQTGVNLVEVKRTYDAATAAQRGDIVPVVVSVFEDRSFELAYKTPPSRGMVLALAPVGSLVEREALVPVGFRVGLRPEGWLALCASGDGWASTRVRGAAATGALRWSTTGKRTQRPRTARLGSGRGPSMETTTMTHQPALPTLAATDPVIAGLVEDEARRQHEKIRLIASENYVSQAVLEATGTVLTNKYSEGYAGKRYYEGQQLIDPVETLAIDRAKALFGADHANVQPYSGSPANLAVYLAFAKPGDAVLGMALPDGGHLTHGWSVSATGKWFDAVRYGVRKETGRVDLDQVRDLAREHRPKLIFCGGTAIPRTIDFPAFAEIAREVDAVLVADIAHIAGLVAGGAHPSPVGHAQVITTTTHKTLRGPRGAMILSDADHAKAVDKAVFPGLQGGPHNHTTAAIAVALGEASKPEFRDYAHAIVANAKALAEALIERGYDLVSGGTDNHLLLVDLTNKAIGGKPAAQALDRAGIELNYNTVPFDPRKPFDPSGIRLGTGAITTRGLRPEHQVQVAEWIDRTVTAAAADEQSTVDVVAAEIREFLGAYPIPGYTA
ncbi:glycine hydroxymethyltransferase [Amycolatopsis magusensis]|uniref:Serine hydroxymethyltransferase n=2 Tax=Amycolatopsis magusensis TaxID=882444 RepID=A0ABS4PIN8_9PSEU|nr:glycine hydroxymethyltransferase [Amycolatopsis magusensis]